MKLHWTATEVGEDMQKGKMDRHSSRHRRIGVNSAHESPLWQRGVRGISFQLAKIPLNPFRTKGGLFGPLLVLNHSKARVGT